MEEIDVGGNTAGAEVQTLNDIQSYLATFNKEIGDGSVITALSGDQLLTQSNDLVQVSADMLGGAAGGSGVVHTAQQANQALVLQTNSANTSLPQLPMAQGALSGAMMLGTQGGQLVQALNTQTLSAASQSVPGRSADAQSGQDSIMLNTGSKYSTVTIVPTSSCGTNGEVSYVLIVAPQDDGFTGHSGNAYQTVTIVPTSEVNQSGEVSYVLIVSPPDEDKNAADLSVYDFKEEKGGEVDEEEDDEDGEGGSPSQRHASSHRPTHAARRIAPVQQLMCNYCNYTSPKRYLLTRHMKTHSEERPHKCNICDRGFKTIASLQNHINTHTGVKPHKCKECDATFTTSGELVRHVRYRHTFEKPHKCTECDYASVELSKLKRHIRSHTGERPYKCPHCSYSSPDTFKLKRHLRIHTGEKPYECDICHARFTQSNSLKAHRQIHTGEKPVYQCELCPTTCGRKTDLKIHVQKLHTSEKPIQCKKCGKSFPDRYTYKIHIKSHDGEKCFKCELCPYAALSQRHLESHILTHTGEKPFRCEQCDMSFRQKQLLKRHKNIYHTLEYVPPVPKQKKHACHECGKTFAHRGNLLRHMILHDPENPLYQEMALKADAEENEEGDEDMDDITAGELQDDSDGIPEGEPSDEDDPDISGSNQVQMQLMDVGKEAEGATVTGTDGNIYVQHQGIVYSLHMPDHTHPDGTIPQGEPNTGTSNEAEEREVIKVEEGAPENKVTYRGISMHSTRHTITEGELRESHATSLVNTALAPSSSVVEDTTKTRNMHTAFGFHAVDEDGIQAGEH